MLVPPDARAASTRVLLALVLTTTAYSQGDVAGAIRAFARATELFPGVALTWYNLAVACNRGGQLSQAEVSSNVGSWHQLEKFVNGSIPLNGSIFFSDTLIYP